MTRRVSSVAEAQAAVAKVVGRLSDFRGLFRRLEDQAIPAHMERVWDRRFDLSLFHAQSTVRARARRRAGTYYGAHAPNERARDNFPFFEWTGSLREAASRFARVERDRAEIDPAETYGGPVPGGFDATAIGVVPDENLFGLRDLGDVVEREIEAWALAEIAR